MQIAKSKRKPGIALENLCAGISTNIDAYK
jgi:hypothetical protein